MLKQISWSYLFSTKFNSIEFITELFIKYKSSINANIICGPNNYTPLFYANGIVIDILLDNGADINHKTGNNITPFYNAAQNLNYDKLVKLYERKANINIVSSFNTTALMTVILSALKSQEKLCYKCCEYKKVQIKQ